MSGRGTHTHTHTPSNARTPGAHTKELRNTLHATKDQSLICVRACVCMCLCVIAATRWKDAVCGTHVEYDQRPDVFR